MCLLNKINRVYQSQISGSLRVYMCVCVFNGSVPWMCFCMCVSDVWVCGECSFALLSPFSSSLASHYINFKIINNCLLKQSFVQLLSKFSFDFRI